MRLARCCRLLAALVLAALALPAAVAPRAVAAPPTVVLISLDGLHPDDLDAQPLPAFERMARDGARAERMLPVFPSNTFPNHVTLATGVSPERHGIVNNVFVDDERGLFSYDGDPTWIEAEPIWAVVDRHGLISASYYWIGSEGKWRNGHGPREWRAFDSKTAEPEKVDQILRWLALPEVERPRLITAWFHGPDYTGHRHGPRSPQALEAMREQDAALGRLLAELDARKAWADLTLLVVSDHGMAPIQEWVNFAGLLEQAGIDGKVHGGGGFTHVRLADPADAERVVAIAHDAGLEAWPRGKGPEGMETRHARFGDVIVLAPLGTGIRRGGFYGRIRSVFTNGGHGYRPTEPSMAASFLALGRGVAPGHRPNIVRTRDVAPTVLSLLGVPVPASMEGRPIPLAPAAPAPAEEARRSE